MADLIQHHRRYGRKAGREVEAKFQMEAGDGGQQEMG